MDRDVDALLARQLAHLASDERLRESAAVAAEQTPEARLREACAMGRAAARMLARLPDDVRARAEAHREPPGEGAERVLRRLAELSRP